MELPPELVELVREFSKPVFIYWKIFNEAKPVIEPKHLKPIREALVGPRADQVCEALKVYMDNLRVLKEFQAIHCDYEHSFGIQHHPISRYSTYDLPRNLTLEQKITVMHNVTAIVNAEINEATQYRHILLLVRILRDYSHIARILHQG